MGAWLSPHQLWDKLVPCPIGKERPISVASSNDLDCLFSVD